jgi:dTDP-4-amino-4,6-dideoxygalactose transaminase
MMDIQAALGIHQLGRAEKNLQVRERCWRQYDRALADIPEISTPSERLPAGSRHARHLYAILLNTDRVRMSRDQFVAALKAENIGTGIHFTALHLHKYYREALGYRTGDLPNAEFIGSRTVSLPLSPKLSEADVEDVLFAIRRTLL